MHFKYSLFYQHQYRISQHTENTNLLKCEEKICYCLNRNLFAYKNINNFKIKIEKFNEDHTFVRHTYF